MSVMDKFKMVRDAGFDGAGAEQPTDHDEVLKARIATGAKFPQCLRLVHCGSRHYSVPVHSVQNETPGLLGRLKTLRDAKAWRHLSPTEPAVVNKVFYADAPPDRRPRIRKGTSVGRGGRQIAINIGTNSSLPQSAGLIADDNSNAPPTALRWRQRHYLWLARDQFGFSGKRRSRNCTHQRIQPQASQRGKAWVGALRFVASIWKATATACDHEALDDVGYTGWGNLNRHSPYGVIRPRLKQVARNSTAFCEGWDGVLKCPQEAGSFVSADGSQGIPVVLRSGTITDSTSEAIRAAEFYRLHANRIGPQSLRPVFSLAPQIKLRLCRAGLSNRQFRTRFLMRNGRLALLHAARSMLSARLRSPTENFGGCTFRDRNSVPVKLALEQADGSIYHFDTRTHS